MDLESTGTNGTELRARFVTGKEAACAMPFTRLSGGTQSAIHSDCYHIQTHQWHCKITGHNDHPHNMYPYLLNQSQHERQANARSPTMVTSKRFWPATRCRAALAQEFDRVLKSQDTNILSSRGLCIAYIKEHQITLLQQPSTAFSIIFMQSFSF